MKNRKFAKLAVVASALSLVMCCTMLLGGGTFAWFTDSVSSDVNTIQSGNLDVVLEYSKNGTNWSDVETATNVFDADALWEPGYTDVVYFKVTNNGSLALKYDLAAKVAEEVPAVNVAGVDFKLSEYIYYGTTEDLAAVENRVDAAKVATSKLQGTVANYSSYLEADESKVVALVVTMPTTVGNEANHNGTAPSITLGVELLATQYTFEEDAFGNDYDGDATFVPDDAPKAIVTYLDVPEQDMYIIPDITQGFGGGSYMKIEPDIAFTFKATDDATSVATSPYKDWLVDYYVSIDKPVKDGVIMIGNYDNWESGAWYGFNVPAGEYTTPVGLLGTMTGGISNWTYEDIVTGVGTFNCGVENTNVANTGKVMTVDLRITNPENTAEYYTLKRVTYTLGNDLPKAKVTYLDVPEQDMYIIPDITQGFSGGSYMKIEPEVAFKFTATDDAASVATNPYKDWLIDYYVSIDEPVEDGVIMIGCYGNWQGGAWYGFNVPAGTYTDAVPLLGAMSSGGISNWTYEDIVTGVGEFNCGVVNNAANNEGKVMTVELRAINPGDASEQYAIKTVKYVLE